MLDVSRRMKLDVPFGLRSPLQQAGRIIKERAVNKVETYARLSRRDHAQVAADGAIRQPRLEIAEGVKFDGFIHRRCRAENEFSQLQDQVAELAWDVGEEIGQLFCSQSLPSGSHRSDTLPVRPPAIKAEVAVVPGCPVTRRPARLASGPAHRGTRRHELHLREIGMNEVACRRLGQFGWGGASVLTPLVTATKPA